MICSFIFHPLVQLCQYEPCAFVGVRSLKKWLWKELQEQWWRNISFVTKNCVFETLQCIKCAFVEWTLSISFVVCILLWLLGRRRFCRRISLVVKNYYHMHEVTKHTNVNDVISHSHCLICAYWSSLTTWFERTVVGWLNCELKCGIYWMVMVFATYKRFPEKCRRVQSLRWRK